MASLRINAGIVEELTKLHEAMEGDTNNDADYYAGDLANIIDAINGKAVRLWRSDTWHSEKVDNPLKQVPDMTLVEAAKQCHRWMDEGEFREGKTWFSALDMDKALRQVINDPSVLPKWIDGRHWGVTMKRLVNDGYCQRVPLVSQRGRPSGHGFVLIPRLRPVKDVAKHADS